MERKDLKGRLLKKGEYQQSYGNNKGRYEYKYIDNDGARRSVYSWRLTIKDVNPKGKYSEFSLRELEDKIQVELEDGVIHGGTTYGQAYCLYEKYLEQRVSVNKLKRSTMNSYEHQSRIWINPYLSDIKLRNLNSRILVDTFEKMQRDLNLSGATIKRLASIISGVITFANKRCYMRFNPVKNAIDEFSETHDLGTRKVSGLTVDQQKQFISFCIESGRTTYLPMISFCLACGCRVGEAGGLTYDDIDFEKKKVIIRRTLNVSTNKDGKEELWIGTPKTENGFREIPLMNDLIIILKKEMERQKLKGGCTKTIDGISNFFFINSYGNPVSRTTFSSALSRLRKMYNDYEIKLAKKERRQPVLIDRLSPNSFRKSFTTFLANSEPNPFIVKSVLGHSKISTTDRYYYDSSYEIKARTFAEKLDGKLLNVVNLS